MVKNNEKELWTCSKCKRQFMKKGQTHSCRLYPLENHFVNKKEGEVLYTYFKKAVKKRLGAFQVESLECCIHLVRKFTFAAVKIFRNKIQVDFGLNQILKNKRIKYTTPMSSKNYLYCVEVKSENEIDDELIDWIEAASRKYN